MMDIKYVWGKALSYRGCLRHAKTVLSRRRYESDEDPFVIANDFVSDEAKILSSKAFRVLKDRTQVFIFPKNPLIRDRKTHTLEVVASSVVASEMLGLNTDLARAAALGHDIGHVPFGHAGEEWLARTMGKPEFCHEVFSSIIAQKIERKGKGLNLSWHTLDAMMRHSGNTARTGMSQEAWVVRYADKFAYLFHDINDIVKRAKYPVSKELMLVADSFGATQRERTTTAIAGLIIESAECGYVSFEKSDLAKKFMELRALMYEVYPLISKQGVDEALDSVFGIVSALNIADPFLMIALMTDTDVSKLTAKDVKATDTFSQTSVSELTPFFKKVGTIDLLDPDLNW